jgi:predicted NUDIX family phosphoesterase
MNTVAAKPKLALGYMASDLPDSLNPSEGRHIIPVDASFYTGKPTHLKDRAEIEEDPSFQHFIPYIVLINERNEVFIYSRGKDGGEKKLVGNLSIGLGGHVDEQPKNGQTLLELLQLEGARELKEEAGLELPYAMQFRKLLIDRTNKVGLVHLGLLAICPVDSRTVLQLDEVGIVEKGEWLTIAALHTDDIYPRLENWSQMALQVVQEFIKEPRA